ncbi:MAG: cytidylate kinase-like family protein [Oscillospiraceae bacterium]
MKSGSASKKLGVPFYDYEIISIAAKDSGYSEELFKKADKKATNSFLYSMSLIGTSGPYNMPLNDKLFLIQSSIIRTIADQGPCVIVGRCSDYVLKDYTKCINVFIYADMASKIKTVMERKSISEKSAAELVIKTDKCRATYYTYYSDQKWGDILNHDICINSSRVGIDNTVSMLKTFVEQALGDELTEAKKALIK